MAFWVYVLKSDGDGSHYTGSAQNVQIRLSEHNRGKNRYTKSRRPWQLIYTEYAKNRSEAVKRERFLKSGIGRKELNKLLPR